MRTIFLFLASICVASPSDSFAETQCGERPSCEEGWQRHGEKPGAQAVLAAFPSSIVAGCVNAVTGDYFESTIDLCTAGPAPIYVQRSWSSANKRWHFTHQPTLEVGMSRSGHDLVTAYQSDHRGGYCYKTHKNCTAITPYGEGRELRVPATELEKGYINCGEGEISAQTHVKNSAIAFCRKRGKRNLTLRYGTHLERVFHRYSGKGNYDGVPFGKFRLEEEQHPNGNRLTYSYMSNGQLHMIRAFSRTHQFLGHVQVTQKDDVTTWRNHFSRVHYRFFYKDRQLISVSPSHGIKVCYNYDSKKQISRKWFPDGRALHIDYDDGKVAALAVAIAGSNEPAVTHTFSYRSWNSDKKEMKVCTAEGEQRIYRSQDKRLTAIEHYADHNRIATEMFSWSKRGDLQLRKLVEGDTTHFIQTLEYDIDGSISKEILAGNLTGRGWQEREKRYQNNTKQHLPIEEDDGRIWKHYSYQAGSNQLTARLTGAGSTILKREFFTYDTNGCIIAEIVDDGTGEACDDLTGVSERHYKKTTPTSQQPCGLPECIEEFYLDLKSGHYQLLRTTIYRYGDIAKPIDEKVYGPQNELLHAISRSYDPLGNITSETDGLGHTVTYTYDRNGNKTREEQPRLTKLFSYDHGNRLVKEEEQWVGGQSLVTTHRYSINGRKLATITPCGRETTFDYDAMRRLIKTTAPAVARADGAATPVIERCRYDAMGNKVQEWDALGNCTETHYTAYGHPYAIIYPDGSSEEKEYTIDGLLCKEVAKNGLQTVYSHDAFGRVTAKEIFSANGTLLKRSSSRYNTFHLLAEVDAAGVETHYRYNDAGQLSSVERAGKVTEYRYDAAGRTSTTIEWIDATSARITHKVYDLLDRVIEERVEALDGTLHKQERYQYDAAGNRTHTIGWSGGNSATTITRYTPSGKPYMVTDPLGHVTRYFYTYSDQLKTVRIDPLGQQEIEWSDSHGHTTMKETHNPAGQCIERQCHYYDPWRFSSKRFDTESGYY